MHKGKVKPKKKKKRETLCFMLDPLGSYNLPLPQTHLGLSPGNASPTLTSTSLPGVRFLELLATGPKIEIFLL